MIGSRVRRRAPVAALLAVVVAVLQAGCTSNLLESNIPAPERYRLGTASPSSPAPAASPVALELALTVARPRASSALNTDRIAVVPAANRFEYYSDVRWAEAAPQMVQQALVAALEASGRFDGVFAAPARSPSELLVDVELRHFESLAAAADEPPAAHVQLQVSLVDSRRATRVTSFVSEARVTATQNRRTAIVAAFEQAHAQVVADVVARIGEAAATLAAPHPQPDTRQ